MLPWLQVIMLTDVNPSRVAARPLRLGVSLLNNVFIYLFICSVSISCLFTAISQSSASNHLSFPSDKIKHLHRLPNHSFSYEYTAVECACSLTSSVIVFYFKTTDVVTPVRQSKPQSPFCIIIFRALEPIPKELNFKCHIISISH